MSSDKERRWVVYRHIFPNGKCYIGITCRKEKYRWSNGYGYTGKNPDGTYKQPKMANAVNKYGWDNVSHEIMFAGLSEEAAKRIEQICIVLFRTKDDRFGYNITGGGDGSFGRVMSEETKRKIGDKAKERLSIPENNPRYGAVLTDETKRRISEGLKGKLCGEKHPFYGKHMSEEQKAKLREFHTGLKASDETRKKMSEAHKGKHAGVNNSCSVPVICLDLAMRFCCFADAAKYVGLSPTTVQDVCRGKITQAKGHYFIREDEFSIERAKELLMENNRPYNIAVVCVETGKLYKTMADAQRDTNTQSADIRKCIFGERKTANKMHWRMATELEWRQNRAEEIYPIIKRLESGLGL